MGDGAAHLERLIEEGDIARAYAEARALNQAGSGDGHSRYLEVLALARMGATLQAEMAFAEYGLAANGGALNLSMAGRLAKDRALANRGEARQRMLLEAARLYHEAYLASEDYFPQINAASLYAAAGDKETAESLASAILKHPSISHSDNYWSAITAVEALILLDRPLDAKAAAHDALGFAPAAGNRSSTVMQFERLLAPAGIGGDALGEILALLRPTPVWHFCGHRFLASADAEADLSARIDRVLAKRGVTAGYGALASGADILVAERILAAAGELHVILPFAKPDFVAQSVAPAGQDWVARFDACLSQATSATQASSSGYVGDPRQYSYGSQVAMGLAQLRASHLAAEALQLALWDGKGTAEVAGTAKDVAIWRASGSETVVLETARPGGSLAGPPPVAEPRFERDTHAILFADISGFSKLDESELADFWETFTTASAQVLEANKDTVLCANTWGDALYLVIDDALTAARIAESLTALWTSEDPKVPPPISQGAIRVALHFGPMFRVDDPITGGRNFIGVEVSRTARLEPVTPRNSVYVTEPFAAVLSMDGHDAYRLIYCGEIDYAKDFGSQAAYLMHRQSAPGKTDG